MIIQYPANEAEAKANRDKFIEALRTEPEDNQCRYALYEDADVEGDNEAERKHQKCALGLAGQVFFGINSVEELSAFLYENRDEAGLIPDFYCAISNMLGAEPYSDADVVDDVLEANDGQGLSFADIAGRLTLQWSVNA